MTRLPAPKIIPSEDEEQIEFIKYLDQRAFKYTAIPNSTYSPHMSVKVRNKKLGLRPGLPDILIALPGIGVVFVEMKRIRNSHTSDDQLEWIDTLNLCPGAEARVCRGAKSAVEFIEELSPSQIGKQWLSSSLF